MSKRFFPQQQGDRKRAKLDISISDHNFPLSQNKEPEQLNTWGDDNDDEILLLASQACEDAYINDVSFLPDYSICMQPRSTSTQMYSSPGPSTSKAEFTFMKPSTNPPSVISTSLREKCNRISSPLPGISAKVTPKPNNPVNLSDDYIFNDKIYKGQDSDYVYKQLLQLQEENAKLKSENGKLLEKCVTKEGEASILRTQLKTCQVSVDNARLEKIKAQEKVQMEWTEKLSAANNQMHDLKTQLDFKNLEIISIKEKCKKLESTKVKLTQVTVANNDISSSYRLNNGIAPNESMTQNRRVKTSSNAVQTEDKAYFVALNKTRKAETSNLPALLPYILEPTASPHCLLEYNEKLTSMDMPHKYGVYSTFHKVPALAAIGNGKDNLQLSTIYEDIVKIASGSAEWEMYLNVFNAAKTVIANVLTRLETLSRRITTAFQKEMDEKYIETTSSFIDVRKEDLLKGELLYKEEQEILARRMVAILSYILESSSSVQMFRKFVISESNGKYFTECIDKICSLLDTTSTATLHSGLLLSLTYTLQTIISSTPNEPKTLEIIRNIIISRPMPFVSCHILELVRDVSLWENFRKEFCPETVAGNLKTDYDQGVLLYKRDSCLLQILLKQIETCLKCIENQDLAKQAVETTRQLLVLYCNLNCGGTSLVHNKSRCDCQLVSIQVTVYSLRICAVMLRNSKTESNGELANSNIIIGLAASCGFACSSSSSELIISVATPESQELLSICRCGLLILHQCSLKDVEFGSHLTYNEGHLVEFCEIMRSYEHGEIYASMLSELASTLQSTPEDMPPSFHRQPWLKSFDSFTITD